MTISGLYEWYNLLTARQAELMREVIALQLDRSNIPKGSCAHRTQNLLSRRNRELRITHQTIAELYTLIQSQIGNDATLGPSKAGLLSSEASQDSKLVEVN
jgi:hypothetical protein